MALVCVYVVWVCVWCDVCVKCVCYGVCVVSVRMCGALCVCMCVFVVCVVRVCVWFVCVARVCVSVVGVCVWVGVCV